ncbi:unnamed protein product [Somion occarium]|uniref:Uncharacterized protein n=1 Tax=Somion occarium TaxID=3059160 RepID=A0ABP1CVE3_9APHY
MAHVSASTSRYAKRRKEQLTLVKKLRAIGAQANIDLPRIAVIGNQSAGKSSLVEAISGISLPRDAVSIRWEYDPQGQRLDEVMEEHLVEHLTDKTDVELALRRAQFWILNPKDSMNHILSLSMEELRAPRENALAYSRNVVCLDISGPELTDLSFVDLPGIIQNAENHLVQLVEELVLSYIRGNCLVLITMPMSDDIENQKAVRLAKQVDPYGDRTIGVLTKPDTLTEGAIKMRNLWLDIIEGHRHTLKHGYYCTRQPDDDERQRGITSTGARAAEEDFFSQVAPWSLSSHRHRFGTRNLVENLGILLSNVINESLPKLVVEVNHDLSACEAHLKTLPKPVTTDPSAYVLNLITSFCLEVRSFVQGGSRTASLVQENRRIYDTYMREIFSTAPQFLPYTVDKQQSGSITVTSFAHDENGFSAEASPSSVDGCMFLNDVRDHIRRSLTRELPNNVPYSAKVALIQHFQTSWKALSARCFEAVHAAFHELLCRLIDSNLSLYAHLEARVRLVVDELVKVKYEDTLVQIFKTLNHEALPFTQHSRYLAETKDNFLSKYKDARAALLGFKPPQPSGVGPFAAFTPPPPSHDAKSVGAVSSSVTGCAHVSAKPTDKSSKIALPDDFKFSEDFRKGALRNSFLTSPTAGSSTATPLKPSIPFTPFWENLPKTAEPLSSFSKGILSEEERKREEANIIAGLARLGYAGVATEDFGKLNRRDEYEEELEMMAEVRAFFQVSYKRIVDYVPMIIDHEFLFACSDALQAFLIEKLELATKNTSERCAVYVAEDAGITTMREELLARKKRLISAQQELLDFAI